MRRVTCFILALSMGCAIGGAQAQVVEFLAVPSTAEIFELLTGRDAPPEVAQLRRANTPRVIRDEVVMPQPSGGNPPQAASAPRPPQSPPPPRRPAAITMPDVFATGSAALPPRTASMLDNHAEALRLAPEVIVLISGHTDASGSAGVNNALSMRRAETARRYLVETRGIAATRIAIIGAGGAEPMPGLAPHAAQNRRIQVRRIGP